MNTPRLFGGAAACLLTAAVIWGMVTRSNLACLLGFVGVCVALYFFMSQLNALERRRNSGPRNDCDHH